MPIESMVGRVFVLSTRSMTYAVYLDEERQPLCAYWGARVSRAEDFADSRFAVDTQSFPPQQLLPYEYAAFGGLRHKETAIKVTFANGTRDLRLAMTGYDVTEDTLCLTLRDAQQDFSVRLYYKLHCEQDILERWCELYNESAAPVRVERCHSAQFSLPGTGYRSINFNGRWSGEFQQQQSEVAAGKLVYESLYGLTGHQCAPAFVLHRDADEESGDVWFGALAYSGNFKVVVENVCNHSLNVVAGISDSDFAWQLLPGERFESPHLYAGYADGLGEMSRRLHRFAREALLPPAHAGEPLPVLYNSWYATEFAVNEAQQCALADKAAALGVELFVMDDGWFKGRFDSTAGLGDWEPCKDKFPQGLTPLITHVRKLGMRFGLWVEPEMVNPNSELFRTHPDWILRYSDREPLQWRSQYMLDMSSAEVREHLFTVLHRLLSENDIAYLKWDMNRYAAEVGAASRPSADWQSLWHRQTLGVYALAARLRQAHPLLELESCASGGGRVDFGILPYADEFWPSDNTDPLDRLAMQRHYSLLYPAKCMRAWVTGDAVFNGRSIPLRFAAHVSMCGALGLGLDLSRLPDEQLAELADYVRQYKEIRDVVQLGDLYRLSDFDSSPMQSVQYLREGRGVIFTFLQAGQYGRRLYRCKAKGLRPDAVYSVCTAEGSSEKSGAYLMQHGIELALHGDWSSQIIKLKTL